jgi:hypothetical protein
MMCQTLAGQRRRTRRRQRRLAQGTVQQAPAKGSPKRRCGEMPASYACWHGMKRSCAPCAFPVSCAAVLLARPQRRGPCWRVRCCCVLTWRIHAATHARPNCDAQTLAAAAAQKKAGRADSGPLHAASAGARARAQMGPEMVRHPAARRARAPAAALAGAAAQGGRRSSRRGSAWEHTQAQEGWKSGRRPCSPKPDVSPRRSQPFTRASCGSAAPQGAPSPPLTRRRVTVPAIIGGGDTRVLKWVTGARRPAPPAVRPGPACPVLAPCKSPFGLLC